MTAAEQQARERLAQCARSLDRLGLFGLSGHISLRVPDSPLIFITPGGGLDKGRLTGVDLAIMDASGNHIAGPYRPPLEWPIHTEIHAARPELAAVAHLHPHWCTVFSVLDRPLDVVVQYAACMGGPIPRSHIPELITDAAAGARLCTALGSAPAILLRGHGTVVVGETLEQMFYLAVVMEENARILWEASMLGKPKVLSKEELARLESIHGGVRAAGRAFQYYANLEVPASEQRHHARGEITEGGTG